MTFLFEKKAIVKKKEVLAFGKFSPKKNDQYLHAVFFLGGEFLHHGDEKEKNIKHSVT